VQRTKPDPIHPAAAFYRPPLPTMKSLVAFTFALLMSAHLAGCTDFMAMEGKVLRDKVVPDSVATTEAITTADGKPVTVRIRQTMYPDSYSVVLETDRYSNWTYKIAAFPMATPVTTPDVRRGGQDAVDRPARAGKALRGGRLPARRSGGIQVRE